MYVKGAPDVLLGNAPAAGWGRTARRSPSTSRCARRWPRPTRPSPTRPCGCSRSPGGSIPAADFDPAGDLWRWAEDWTFLGLAGLMDPPRPEAAEAIARCREAGIQVKMITGDHRITAAAVARELGLHGEVVSGADLDAMPVEELARRIDASPCSRGWRPGTRWRSSRR
jgi:P-type Ca2+ transporter type 2C